MIGGGSNVGKIVAEVEVRYDGKGLNRLSTDLTKTKASLAGTDAAAAKTAAGAKGVAGSIAGLSASLAKFTTSAKLAVASMAASMRNASAVMAAAGARMKATGSAMMARGSAMSRRFTLPIAAIGAVSVKASVDFNKSMTKIASLVGVANKEVDSMREPVIKMASAYGKSATEAADALFFITSAGLRGQTAIDTLRISLKASAVGLGETKVIADLLTSAVNAYGASNLNAAQAGDYLTGAVRAGKLEADQLASAMGAILPISSAMGVGFEEVSAAMAAMSKTGTTAAQAQVQLKGILTSILKPTKEAEDQLAKMGLSSQGLQEKLDKDGLLPTLQLLSERFDGNTSATAKVFGNVRALTGVLDLLGKNSKSTEQVFKDVAKSAGDLDKALEITEGEEGYQMAKAWTTIKNSLIPIGDVVTPIAASVAQALAAIATAFTKLPGPVKTAVVIFASVVAAVGPIQWIFGAIVSSIGTLITAFSSVVMMGARILPFFVKLISLVRFLPLAFGPVGLAITAAAILIGAAAYLIIKNWDKVKVFLGNVWDWIKTAAGNVADFIVGAASRGFLGPVPLIIANWGKVKGFLGNVWNWIKTAAGNLANFVVGAARRGFLGPVPWIIANWGKVKSFLSGLWSAIKSLFSAGASAIVSAARKGFLGPIPWIISNWEKIRAFFGRLPSRIASVLSGLAAIILSPFQSAADAIGRVLDGIVSKFTSAIDAVKSAASSVGDAISSVGGKLGFGRRGGVFGPGAGGVAIVGEGRKQEWVISQEGSREQNIGYLMQAAEALGIPMMQRGGTINYQKPNQNQLKWSYIPFWEKELAKAEAETPDDPKDDLKAIHALRDIYKNTATNLEDSGIREHKKRKPNQKARKYKGKNGKKKFNRDMKAWRNKLQVLNDRRLESYRNWKQYEDQLNSLSTIDQEAETGAQAVGIREQLGFFGGERLALLTSFAGNIRQRSMATGAGIMPAQAGAPQGMNNATGTSVSIVQNYQEPPTDPHAWTRELQNEITATL